MQTQTCLFCGGDSSEPGHLLVCDGRQGVIEQAIAIADVEPENYARRTDPPTAHAAAASVREQTIRALHRLIADILTTAGPLSDSDILIQLHDRDVLATPSGARTRRSELVHAGLVIDSGQRGTTPTGRRTISGPSNRRTDDKRTSAAAAS